MIASSVYLNLGSGLQTIVLDVLVQAKHLGCTAAEVGVSREAGFCLTVRMGQVETLEYNNDHKELPHVWNWLFRNKSV